MSMGLWWNNADGKAEMLRENTYMSDVGSNIVPPAATTHTDIATASRLES